MKIKEIEEVVLDRYNGKYMKDCLDPVLLNVNGIYNPVEARTDYILMSMKLTLKLSILLFLMDRILFR